MSLDREFDVVAMPGNVMVFCRPSDRGPIIRTAAGHLDAGGALVAGFQLESGTDALTLDRYDELCNTAGLRLDERWSTWTRDDYAGRDYAVSVHRH